MFIFKIEAVFIALWKTYINRVRPVWPRYWTHPDMYYSYLEQVKVYARWKAKRQLIILTILIGYPLYRHFYFISDLVEYEFFLATVTWLQRNTILDFPIVAGLNFSFIFKLRMFDYFTWLIFIKWYEAMALLNDHWIAKAQFNWDLYLEKKIEIYYLYGNIGSFGVYIAITFIYVLVGGTIPLFERKYLSLIQRRIGPKFVGYNGRLQILADALKLLFKELIVLKSTNTFIFFTLPILTLVINLFLCGTMVWVGSIYIFDTTYTIFVLLIVELLTTIMITYIGLLTKNKYTLITSVRIINGTVVFEIFLIAVLSYFYLMYDTTGFLGAFNNPLIQFKLLYLWTVVGILLHFVLLVLKKVPFDIIEAETELIMGYTSEHSGFLSGSLILVEYLHLLFWSYFIGYAFLI